MSDVRQEYTVKVQESLLFFVFRKGGRVIVFSQNCSRFLTIPI